MSEEDLSTNLLEKRVDRLTRLIEVTKSVAAQLDLEPLLQQIVDTATGLLHAQMGGLLVFNIDKKSYQYFKVSGWPNKISGTPSGSGLLSVSCQAGVPLRIDRVASHPQRTGFPEGHPVVEAFLSVPLMRGSETLGSLFVGNAPLGPSFSDDDEELLLAFAAQATIAIENARLYAQAEELARTRERNRIAQDLHDMVAQMLFTIGLEADWCATNLSLNPDAQKRLHLIRKLTSRSSDELRSVIFALQSPFPEKVDSLISLLSAQISEFKAQTGIEVSFIYSQNFPRLPALMNEAVYRIVRESLSNVNKHANASGVIVNLRADEDAVTISILDDGVGLPAVDSSPSPEEGFHFGVVSMRKCAEQARGVLQISNNEDNGACVRARFPLPGVKEV